jgi:uncharacterized protein (TIRG00374 family)
MGKENTSVAQASKWRMPRFVLGLVLSMLTLYLALKNVQWPRVATALVGANVAWLLLAVASFLLTNWVKGVRWRLLFYPSQTGLSVPRCVSILYVGQLANSILPMRLGELARAYLIGEAYSVDKVLALATTVVEKAMDSVVLLLLIAGLSPLIPLPPWLSRSSLIVSGALAALLVLLIILANQRGKIVGLLEGWIVRYPPLAVLRPAERLVDASAELRALRHAGVQAQLWGCSVVIWMLAVSTNVLTLWAVGLKLSLLASVLLLVVLTTGAILPTSPLQIGVFHYLCLITLAVFGVEQSLALTYAFLLHLVVYGPILALGLWGMWREDYDLGRLGPTSRGEGA